MNSPANNSTITLNLSIFCNFMRIILMLTLAVLALSQPSYAGCQEFKVVEYEDSVEVVCVGEELPADDQSKAVLNESDQPVDDLPLNESDIPGNNLQVNDRRANDQREYEEDDQKNEQLRLKKLISEMNPTQPQQIIDVGS